jgi:hypothetical protein
MLCEKCRKFFPPGYVMNVNPKTQEPLNGNLCIFCILNVKEIIEGTEKVKKTDVVKEYDIFLKKLSENKKSVIEGFKKKDG